MSESPLYMNEVCYGIDLRNFDIESLRKTRRINLQWMIDIYNTHPRKEVFFDSQVSNQIGNIDLLAGSVHFKDKIKEGKTIQEIQASWEPELTSFKKIRKKYLLYK